MKVEVAILGSPVPNSPYGVSVRSLWTSSNTELELECSVSASELRSCVKVEVAVLGSPVPNSPYGLCGRKATLNPLSTNRLLPFTVPR